MLLAEFQKSDVWLSLVIVLKISSLFLLMLTEEEKDFITFWEEYSDKQKKISYQITSGLPFGLAFALPVLVALLFHNWYKRMSYISNSQVVVVFITVMIITLFISIFRKKFQWEQNDQLYKELKFREKKIDAADS